MQRNLKLLQDSQKNLKIFKPFLILLLLLGASLSGFSQLVEPPVGMEFGLHTRFNPTFIKNNKISEIRCDVEIKKDGDRIRDAFRVDIYHFYENGDLKMIAHINQKLRDTSITFFEYTNGRLECEVRNDAAGMYSYCYEYDKNGRPSSLKYGRAERYSSLTASLDRAASTEITTENYTYNSYENQLHSTLHNSAGRPYLKEIRYFDENEYLTKYLKTYIMSSGRLEEKYTYNERGWLSEKTIDDGSSPFTLQYAYDDVGNLTDERKLVDNELIYRTEYVYLGKNMHLKAELKREEKNQLIVITTYEYKYRN